MHALKRGLRGLVCVFWDRKGVDRVQRNCPCGMEKCATRDRVMLYFIGVCW